MLLHVKDYVPGFLGRHTNDGERWKITTYGNGVT